jgi:cytochrome c553
MIKQALFLAAAMLLCASAQAAGNAAEGQKKSTTCAACHGADGNTPVGPDFPKLAGQHRDYLAKALSDYKSGARKNAIMSGQVANLSHQDILDLAAYFSSNAGALHIVPISRLKGSGH